MTNPPAILLGAGGHAKVVLDLLRDVGFEILGVCDPQLASEHTDQWLGLPVLGDDSAVDRYAPDAVLLANGLGSLPGNSLRRRVNDKFTQKGYCFATLVHSSAIVGSDVKLGSGTQIMAGVIIQAATLIGDDTILNTGARVDHDGEIGDHVHIAPGAVLSGNVSVGNSCHIGPGATVIQGVEIGAGAIIGAGTVVLSNVPPWHKVLGAAPNPPSAMSSMGEHE